MNFDYVINLVSKNERITFSIEKENSLELNEEITHSERSEPDEWKQEYEIIYHSYILET